MPGPGSSLSAWSCPALSLTACSRPPSSCSRRRCWPRNTPPPANRWWWVWLRRPPLPERHGGPAGGGGEAPAEPRHDMGEYLSILLRHGHTRAHVPEDIGDSPVDHTEGSEEQLPSYTEQLQFETGGSGLAAFLPLNGQCFTVFTISRSSCWLIVVYQPAIRQSSLTWVLQCMNLAPVCNRAAGSFCPTPSKPADVWLGWSGFILQTFCLEQIDQGPQH